MRGMGRIFRRGSVYWIAYYHRGVEHRESSESESESQAKKLLKKRLGEIGNRKFIGTVEEKLTFDQLAKDLITEYEVNGRRSIKSAKLSISHLTKFFAFDAALTITTDRVRAYIAMRQQEIAEKHSKQIVCKLQKAGELKERAKAAEGLHKARLLAEAGWLEEEAKGLEAISNASINRELSALKRMFALAIQAGKLSSKLTYRH